MTNEKQVLVRFTFEQKNIIDTLKGKMGATDAEVIRNIFLAWLSEQKIMSDIIRKELNKDQ